jgi:hypothetical protein
LGIQARLVEGALLLVVVLIVPNSINFTALVFLGLGLIVICWIGGDSLLFSYFEILGKFLLMSIIKSILVIGDDIMILEYTFRGGSLSYLAVLAGVYA